MFLFSKIAGFFVRVDTIVLLLFGVSIVLLTRLEPKVKKVGLFILVGIFFGALLLTYTSTTNMLIRPLENRFPAQSLADLPDRVDGVIVLGGAIDSEMSAKRFRLELTGAGDRVAYFSYFAHRYPLAKIVYTSGSGYLDKQDYPEAPIARRWMEELNVPQDKIVYESTSRNTYENAVESRKLVSPKPDEIWILVTSAFHMPRAVGVFRNQAWPVIPFPVDFRSLPNQGLFDTKGLFEQGTILTLAFKECIGLIAYRLLGRTDTLLPS